MSITLNEVLDRTGMTVLDHLDREVSVPVNTGLQCQGDVAILPAAGARFAATTAVPKAGYPVVRGESGGNTHSLHGDGSVFFDPAEQVDARALRLGVLSVPDGSTAYLIHPEHGAMGIGPGTYELRRQREQADEIALVAD